MVPGVARLPTFHVGSPRQISCTLANEPVGWSLCHSRTKFHEHDDLLRSGDRSVVGLLRGVARTEGY